MMPATKPWEEQSIEELYWYYDFLRGSNEVSVLQAFENWMAQTHRVVDDAREEIRQVPVQRFEVDESGNLILSQHIEGLPYHEVSYELSCHLYRKRDNLSFQQEDICNVLACIPGYNEEYLHYWVLALEDGRFALIAAHSLCSGWHCDSQGWYKETATLQEVIENAPLAELVSGRAIRKMLIAQINGMLPFGVDDSEGF